MNTALVRLQSEDFDISEEISRLVAADNNIGAIVTFTGLCRDEGRLEALELEHYPGMAESEITNIAEEAISRFALDSISVIHRYGKIPAGENIVLVIAASRHRQAAFDGASYVMDFLKTRAPFWKKEHLANGEQGCWVDARDSDALAEKKWMD